jgi:AraC-like DNA-binding protein
MKQHTYKEITPVFYGEDLVKILTFSNIPHDRHCFTHHYHERMELLRMHSGKMTLQIGSQEYIAKTDELYIISPNQPHSGKTETDDVKYDVIMFDLANLNNNSFAYHKYVQPIINGDVVFENVTSHPDILEIADAIVSAYTEKQTVHSLCTIGMIYNILGAFYQHCVYSSKTSAKPSEINTITDYINAHFTEPISTGTLSKVFGYNSAYFSRKFKTDTGTSVTHYIQSLRIEHAQKLLRDTSESVLSVALQSGFSDVYYFSCCFKKHLDIQYKEWYLYKSRYRTKRK